MGAWSEVKGSIIIQKSSRFSVVKALHDHFDDYEAIIHTEQLDIGYNKIRIELNFAYSLENEGAYKTWKKFADYIRDNLQLTDSSIGMDVTVSIRWII